MSKRRKTPNQIEYEKQIKRIKRITSKLQKQGIHFYDLNILEKPKRITKKRLELLKSIKPKDISEKGVQIDYETGEVLDVKVKRPKGYKKTENPLSKYERSLRRSKVKEPENIEEPTLPIDNTESDVQFDYDNVKDYTPIDNKPIDTDTYNDYDFYDYDDYNPYYEPPTETDTTLSRVRDILSSSQNAAIGSYLSDLLESVIDEEGEDVVAARLSNARSEAIETANGVSYEPSDQEKLKNYAYRLACLITGEFSVPGYMAESIEELAYEDIPFTRRSSGSRNRYKIGI